MISLEKQDVRKPPRRLLLLEDDPNDATLLRRLLLKEWPDCELVQADGESAFKMALIAGGFDLILSDYLLPGFDGLSALALARERFPDIPVVFVSGAIGDEVAIESLKAGATDYVLKDRLAKLVPAIRRALNEAEERACRRQTELRLLQSEEQYRDLFENATDLIQIMTPQGRFVYVNRAWREALEYAETEVAELALLDVVHPEYHDQCRAWLSNAKPDQPMEWEAIFLTKSGAHLSVEGNVGVRFVSGELVAIRGIFHDVTERKRTEKKMRRIQSKLEHTNQDLVRKNQEIQNFYHTLSHELKTPLTSAREFISIVIDGLAGPLNKTQTEYLGIAKESCNQLRACINDLLDSTRMETGKLALELKPSSLAALVERVVAAMQPQAAQKKIVLSRQLQPDLPDVPMDEHRMTQVITNLLTNAIKYTPPGGKIVVKVGESPEHRELVEVAVTDTGCGIPRDEQEHIFERLYQVKAGDATTEQGVGLGLYLSRELVQLHGGIIRVDSEPGKGSTFSFVLPLTAALLHANLLVIDDDPGTLNMLQLLLSSEQYNVRTARDGLEGLEEMRRQSPDIVLLDLAMPNLNGPATLKEIREGWGAIPVIVHTGFTDGQLMKEALAFSPFTLLAKPSPADQILETVRKIQRSGDTSLWKKNHHGLEKPGPKSSRSHN